MRFSPANIALLCSSILLFFSVVAPAQENLLELAPAKAEVIARLKPAEVAQSTQFDLLLEKHGRRKARNQLKFIQNLTDLDLLKDITDVYLFSRIDEDKSVIIVARGTYNQEKLIDLVRINEHYQEKTVSGIDVHYWEDDGEKFATFLEDDLLALAGSQWAMEALLDVRRESASAFLDTPAGQNLPDDLDTFPFWGMLVKTPEIDCEFGQMARSIDLSYVLLTAELNESSIDLRLRAMPDRRELVTEYLKVSEGGIAVAKLLKEEEDIARILGDDVATRPSADGKALDIIGSLSNQEFIELVDQKF